MQALFSFSFNLKIVTPKLTKYLVFGTPFLQLLPFWFQDHYCSQLLEFLLKEAINLCLSKETWTMKPLINFMSLVSNNSPWCMVILTDTDPHQNVIWWSGSCFPQILWISLVHSVGIQEPLNWQSRNITCRCCTEVLFEWVLISLQIM